MSEKSMKVPIPGRNLTSRQIAEARGWADAFALKLRHHNAAAHAKSRPVEPVARAVFDALEQVRVEALGAREMEGVEIGRASCRERGVSGRVDTGGGRNIKKKKN